MKQLKILIVDDEDHEKSWAESFCKNIKDIPLSHLVGDGYESMRITWVTNQNDADKAVDEIGDDGYDIILLDQRYPLIAGGSLNDDENSPDSFQGMKWLKEGLRRLQPTSTIVIVTSHVKDRHLINAVKAIRDHSANDFIPKTESFDNIVLRIRVAWERTSDAKQLRLFEETFSNLIRTRAIRAYAEDIGVMLSQTKTSLFNVARRIESGDASEMAAAADLIRNQFGNLRKEFDELTALVNDAQGTLTSVDIPQLIHQMLMLYRRMTNTANAKVIQPQKDKHLSIKTYEGDLKVALHEVITNAIDALAESKTPDYERKLEVTAKESEGKIVVCVKDNGDGFSPEALEHFFERGYSSKKRDGRHQGLGLYIARRMMHHIGGSIRITNAPEGGAEVTLTFKDLAPY